LSCWMLAVRGALVLREAFAIQYQRAQWVCCPIRANSLFGPLRSSVCGAPLVYIYVQKSKKKHAQPATPAGASKFRTLRLTFDTPLSHQNPSWWERGDVCGCPTSPESSPCHPQPPHPKSLNFTRNTPETLNSKPSTLMPQPKSVNPKP